MIEPAGSKQEPSEPSWRPKPLTIPDTNMALFMEAVEKDWNVTIDTYNDLYRFSVREIENFWQSLRDFVGVTAETWGLTVLADPDKMPGARWFPDAKLNFAENLLRRRDSAEAIVFRGEDKVRRTLTFAELYDAVSLMVQAFRAAGLKPGDRVGGYLPNMPETIIAMLAATSIGAVWSSCSPDFGVDGVVDRFGQIAPRFLVACDGYYYNGRTLDCLGRLAEIQKRLPSLERTIVVPYTRETPPLNDFSDTVLWGDFIKDLEPETIHFERLPFDQPVYILYSSGTTGAPKCIVHGAGGTLLQHLKEHQLHCGMLPGDRVFYFTTCGWMMWNWLVSALATQATLVLYDGSPFYPDGNVLFDYADEARVTLFGTAAKYIDAIQKAGLKPRETHRLEALRTMTSTGSPLAPESFDFVYDEIKRDLHLASISGGTDIVACFVLGNPIAPVWRGEIQTPALGMAVEIFDENGQTIRAPNEKGELVCTKPFPSMPLGFWNDQDGAKYRAAYFERFPGVWHHGDFIAWGPHGGLIIYGRSDATLNPGGVRIGTAEIYRQVEQLDEVMESIVVGQEWQSDVRVVLFVVLRQGIVLDEVLTERIQARIRAHCSPRHVPAKVIQVTDIPRTKSGKITELAVREVIHDREVKNREALANPEALELFRNLSVLKT